MQVLVDFGDAEEDEKALATWLASEDPKMLHGAKAAYHMLAGRGFELNGVVHDTAIGTTCCVRGNGPMSLPTSTSGIFNASCPQTTMAPSSHCSTQLMTNRLLMMSLHL